MATIAIHPSGLKKLAQALTNPKPPTAKLIRLMSKETSDGETKANTMEAYASVNDAVQKAEV